MSKTERHIGVSDYRAVQAPQTNKWQLWVRGLDGSWYLYHYNDGRPLLFDSEEVAFGYAEVIEHPDDYEVVESE
jgi:hypothetical protein